VSAPRVSLERLRERTDELELLISGLSLFGLLALPGLLNEAYLDNYARLPVAALAALSIALPMMTAMAYALAACLVLHLAVRAYWVGLIGLRSVFPDGVRWSSPSLGPVQRERLEARSEDPDAAVARADRWASTVFAVFVFCAMSLAVLGGWLTLAMIVLSLVGGAFGATNEAINRGLGLIILALLGALATLWLLDGVLARRFPRLLRVPGFRHVVCGLAATLGAVFPERLFGAIRLPLQTHLRRRVFFPLLGIVFYGLPWLGLYGVQGQLEFDRFATQAFVTSADLEAGEKSAHYANQRHPSDRTRVLPIIPAPVIEGDWVPLFLPYFSIRDDAVLTHRCASLGADLDDPAGLPSDTDERAAAQEAAATAWTARAARCLATVWEVRIDGRPVDLSTFTIAQRTDLGFRGLSGYVDLRDGPPGPRRLEVIWRPRPEADPPMDDFIPGRTRYTIPLLWTPN
jgi:hypothetical protein